MSGTGGSPNKCNSLTPTEGKVSELLDLKTDVSGLPRTKSFCVNLVNSCNILDPSPATSASTDEELNDYLMNDDSDIILNVPSTLDKPTNCTISNLENSPSTSKTTRYITQRNFIKPNIFNKRLK